MSTKDMLICVEKILNKGTYYLLCDVNYCITMQKKKSRI